MMVPITCLSGRLLVPDNKVICGRPVQLAEVISLLVFLECIYTVWIMAVRGYPIKQKALTQWWSNVRPASKTMGQHKISLGKRIFCWSIFSILFLTSQTSLVFTIGLGGILSLIEINPFCLINSEQFLGYVRACVSGKLCIVTACDLV